MRTRVRAGNIAGVCACFAGPLLHAQTTASAAGVRDPGAGAHGALASTRAEGPVRLDGRGDEGFWATADSLTDFRQREPLESAPASERTVVKVAYDANALYVLVRCDDAEPGAIRARQLRRDADLESDDHLQLLIDSFNDQRSAFVFATNPRGVIWDAQFSGVDDLNEDWNGVWDVATTRDAGGWTAEFRIPFRALRFRAGGQPVFGFNVRRFIRRKNEEDLWRAYGRAEGLYFLAGEGALTGLGSARRPGGAELWPYVLGRAIEAGHDSAGTVTSDASVGVKAGMDAKLAAGPALTADLTVNADFAQTEADQQVINLTRFPFFFPEKRQFFLEASGLFSFGTEERAQLFYSRRIGLDTAGNPVPILLGARLHGRAGPWKLGFLDARTGGDDRVNDLVVRVQHDLFDRSYVGAIVTIRGGPGAPAGMERAGGLDIDLPLVLGGVGNLEPKVWVAGSQVPGVPGTPVAWRLSADNPNDLFDNFVSLYRVAAGFAPPLGFVRRTGIWETTGHVDFQPRPGVLGVRQLDIKFPIPSWDIIAGDSGSLAHSTDWETAEFEWRPLGGTLQSGDEFEANVQRFFDAPTDTFEIFPGALIAPGRYWWSRYEVQYRMSAERPLSVEGGVSWGGFYAGRSTDVELSAVWRGGGHLIAAIEVGRTEAQLAGGSFAAVQTAGRLEYDVNPRTSLLGFVQYNNESQRVDFNFRFHWIPVIGDDVYLVWNSGYTTDPAAPHRLPDRPAWGKPLNGAFVVKVVHRLVP